MKVYLRKQKELLGISSKQPISAALDQMIKNETPVLIVFDDEQNIAGIMTDRDYLRLAQKRRSGTISKDDDKLLVNEIMTPKDKLVTVNYTDSVDSCQVSVIF